MPSHIAHIIFAEEAISEALGQEGKNLLSSHGNILRFGAQGPDIFYHNQRTMPTGLRYGVLAHKHGFGTLVESMAKEAMRLNATPQSELAAFIFGFATHAPLDRRTHPYIGYRAGWVDPARPETARFFHCHPFLERILDVLVLRERRGVSITDFDFLPLLHCGKTLPYQVVKTLVKGLNSSYPSLNYKSRDRRRVDNAYRDTIFFYKVTDHKNSSFFRLVYKKDLRDGFHHRRLALVHPPQVPEGVDFLNVERNSWCHPCDENDVSHATFMELYQQALADAVKAVQDISEVIARRVSPEGLAAKIGEESLDTGRENCTPRFSDPFPLPQIIDAMYGKLEKEIVERRQQ